MNQRPKLITIICIIDSIKFFLALPILYESYVFHINDTLIYYYISTTFLSLIALFIIWKMKVMGIYFYLSIFIVNQLILISLNQWDIYQSLLPFVFLIIGFCYLKKMH